MSEHAPTFFKAPRYLLRKLNIVRMIKGHRAEIDTFLDVGCGAGELDNTLAEAGLKGVGLDFSEAAIEHAETIRKKRGLKESQAVFHVGGLEQVKELSFDLVICCEVLEHVKDDKKFLHDLLGHADKYVIISVPAKQKLFDASDKAVGHFRRYERAQLRELLESEHLEILELSNYGYPFANMVRIARKAAFVKKLKGSGKTTSMKDKSKESGINPVSPPSVLKRMDIEPAMKPLYHISRAFNQTNLAEGYLAFCRKKT